MKKRLLICLLALLGAPLPALATICSTYPYTLTNGQTADATQVMADFNSILTCVNTNVASAGTNSNITALLGLSTPLSLAQGGTGQTSLSGLQSALGLGTAAYLNSGTSGATVPVLNGATPTWAAGANYGGAVTITAGGLSVTGGAATDTLAVSGSLSGAGVTSLLAPYAPLASPTLTGSPTAPTQTPGDSSTKIATDAFVANAVAFPVAQFRYQVTSGTANAETINATTWTQRTLNTTVVNTISGASLSSNQVTLPAGTYEVTATAQAGWSAGLGGLKSRVRDVTASATLVSGQNINSQTYGLSTVQGRFTLGAAHAVELDSYVTQTGGFGGGATSSGEAEVYVDIYFRKVG